MEIIFSRDANYRERSVYSVVYTHKSTREDSAELLFAITTKASWRTTEERGEKSLLRAPQPHTGSAFFLSRKGELRKAKGEDIICH